MSPVTNSPAPSDVPRLVARSSRWRPLVEALRVLSVGVGLAAIAIALRGAPSIDALRAEAPVSCGAPLAPRWEPPWIEPTEAVALHAAPDVCFVDARSRGEFVRGHIAGGLSVPMDDGTLDPAALEAVRGARTVIAYCDSSSECADSRRLANLLAEAGVRDVRVLRGGMPAWLEHEAPAEAGACPLCP